MKIEMAQKENEKRKCLYNPCLSGNPVWTIFWNNHPSAEEFSFVLSVSWWDRQNLWGEGCYPHFLYGMTQPSCCYLLLEEARYFHFQNPVLVMKNGHISKPFCSFWSLLLSFLFSDDLRSCEFCMRKQRGRVPPLGYSQATGLHRIS